MFRKCSRTNCQEPAVATMTYGYREATAVVGPLSPTPQRGAFDLCADHANQVTVPVGWQLVRLQTEFEPAPPALDDLLALAEAIKETSRREVPPPAPAEREIRRPLPQRPTRPELRIVED